MLASYERAIACWTRHWCAPLGLIDPRVAAKVVSSTAGHDNLAT
jgi:hypothetical protein